MNLPAHGTLSPDPHLHQSVQTIHISCTKLTWARSLSLSDRACLAQAKLPRLSERATKVTYEVPLRRAHLAWARPLFAQHNISRLGSKTTEHTCINADFSLRRVPLAWARYSIAQNMGSSPKRDPRAQPHSFVNPHLSELLSPKRDMQTQLKISFLLFSPRWT